MNLEDYRMAFIGTSLVLMLVAASPVLSVVVPFSGDGERFSELWVLGPTHMAEGYPFNVVIGGKEQVFVGVGNHMDRSSYYVVYVKFRNQTQAAPNSTASMPSPLAPLFEFHAIVANGKTWETSVAFSFLEGSSRFGDSFIVRKISINDVVFAVESLAVWDLEHMGFYYQLFFELWMYDDSVSSFQYQNRFVGIWLNITV